jgi:hypothetical protein
VDYGGPEVAILTFGWQLRWTTAGPRWRFEILAGDYGGLRRARGGDLNFRRGTTLDYGGPEVVILNFGGGLRWTRVGPRNMEPTRGTPWNSTPSAEPRGLTDTVPTTGLLTTQR